MFVYYIDVDFIKLYFKLNNIQNYYKVLYYTLFSLRLYIGLYMTRPVFICYYCIFKLNRM